MWGLLLLPEVGRVVQEPSDCSGVCKGLLGTGGSTGLGETSGPFLADRHPITPPLTGND